MIQMKQTRILTKSNLFRKKLADMHISYILIYTYILVCINRCSLGADTIQVERCEG